MENANKSDQISFADPVLLPRYLHMMTGALAVGGDHLDAFQVIDIEKSQLKQT